MSEPRFKKAMVFGVFDGLHPGHQYFLTEAARRAEELIVVVTRTEIVELLKNRLPKNTLEERSARIKYFHPEFRVISGDSKLGEWTMLKKFQPEIVFLGHDQRAIAKELDKLNIPYSYISKLNK